MRDHGPAPHVCLVIFLSLHLPGRLTASRDRPREDEVMDSHERTATALSLQQPDRVPVFYCTEVQNQVYEILGEEGRAVALESI